MHVDGAARSPPSPIVRMNRFGIDIGRVLGRHQAINVPIDQTAAAPPIVRMNPYSTPIHSRDPTCYT
jgi:hypothetical protein